MRILPFQTTAPAAGTTGTARTPETPFANLLGAAARPSPAAGQAGTAAAGATGLAGAPGDPGQASSDEPAQTAEDAASAWAQHAFGFAQLGIFGIHGPLADGDSPTAALEAATQTSAALVAANPTTSPAAPYSEAIGTMAELSFAGAGATADAVSQALEPATSLEPGGPGLLGAPTAAHLTTAPDESAEEISPVSGAAPQGSASEEAQGASQRLSLTLSGTDGQLQILAASPELGAEAGARLAQRLAEVSGEFGLTLTELHHNGVRTAAPPARTRGSR